MTGSDWVLVEDEPPSSSRETAAPLTEISANVVRIPHTTVAESHVSADSETDSDHLQTWKTLLSPVAEESPSPRKGSPRKTRKGEENLLLNYSSRLRNLQKSPEDSLLRYSLQMENGPKSPQKAPSRPLSPGSLKMQNFLRRLERQGLSHD